jgi:hypothetical protein
VGAMHAGATGGVDVELPAHDNVVARVRRHPGRQPGVVVDLEMVPVGVSDQQVLVASHGRRLRGQTAVEGHLGAGAAGGEVRAQGRVVGPGTVAAGGQQT